MVDVAVSVYLEISLGPRLYFPPTRIWTQKALKRLHFSFSVVYVPEDDTRDAFQFASMRRTARKLRELSSVRFPDAMLRTSVYVPSISGRVLLSFIAEIDCARTA